MSNTAAGNGRFPVATPTLLESNSDSMGVSDSSSSPQTPHTPQLYGRMRPRYPQELGRVPLHRRGTSKTYERLEDLLKEAGYKETRIFTPEAERTGKYEDDDDATVVEDKRTSMVKDVVGFLAGLIPGAGASVALAESLGSKVLDPSTGSQTRGTKNPQQPSPSFSALAKKAALPPLSRHEQQAHVDPHPTQSEHPQIVIHPTTPHNQTHVHRQSYQAHPHKQHPVHQKPHGLGIIPGSNIHEAPPHITTNLHSPRPSRATAYLRHMASAPNVISKRPNSTPVDLSHSPKSRLRVSLNEGDSHEKLKPQGGDRGGNGQQPPLPTSWLETVARAVLFGGAGAHIGGPLSSHQVANVDSNHHERRAPPLRQLRSSRSSLSQVSHKSRYYNHHQHRSKKSPMSSGLSDSTNFTPSTATSSAFLTPGLPSPMPALFAQIERGRADRCVSEVSLARVMCRSAPGSRSGSVVRSEVVGIGVEKNRRKNLDVESEVEMQRGERGRNRGVKRRGAGGGWLKGREERLRVPSLARMHVEGDVWSSNMKTRKRSRPESGCVVGSPGFGKGKAGYASEGEVVEYESYSDESEEDEEEGELNLARMLVPPKRQNSIKSLRKHLLASVADSGGSHCSGAHSKLRRVHLASAGKKGGEGAKLTDGRFRRQTPHPTSLARNDTDEEREDDPAFGQDTRHTTGVLSLNGGNLKLQNQPQTLNAPLARWGAGDSEDQKRRNSCSDDEDVDSFAGFFDVGSGRSSTSGRRLGIGTVWNVIGGGAE